MTPFQPEQPSAAAAAVVMVACGFTHACLKIPFTKLATTAVEPVCPAAEAATVRPGCAAAEGGSWDAVLLSTVYNAQLQLLQLHQLLL
jgi:hypothetical protein